MWLDESESEVFKNDIFKFAMDFKSKDEVLTITYDYER